MADDCVFCRIAGHESPAEVVFEDDDVVVFKDLHPAAPIHLLVVPKEHIPTVQEAKGTTVAGLVDRARQLAVAQGFAENGYKLVINCGHDGGQVVNHLHLHLLAGTKLSGI